MTIVNKRNAVFGWAVWNVGKRIGKRKARALVPGTGDYAGLNKPAIASIVTALGGAASAVFFWRKKSSDSASG